MFQYCRTDAGVYNGRTFAMFKTHRVIQALQLERLNTSDNLYLQESTEIGMACSIQCICWIGFDRVSCVPAPPAAAVCLHRGRSCVGAKGVAAAAASAVPPPLVLFPVSVCSPQHPAFPPHRTTVSVFFDVS